MPLLSAEMSPSPPAPRTRSVPIGKRPWQEFRFWRISVFLSVFPKSLGSFFSQWGLSVRSLRLSYEASKKEHVHVWESIHPPVAVLPLEHLAQLLFTVDAEVCLHYFDLGFLDWKVLFVNKNIQNEF
jgi:hypothetical protein